jgi:hypothetical protein
MIPAVDVGQLLWQDLLLAEGIGQTCCGAEVWPPAARPHRPAGRRGGPRARIPRWAGPMPAAPRRPACGGPRRSWRTSPRRRASGGPCGRRPQRRVPRPPRGASPRRAGAAEQLDVSLYVAQLGVGAGVRPRLRSPDQGGRLVRQARVPGRARRGREPPCPASVGRRQLGGAPQCPVRRRVPAPVPRTLGRPLQLVGDLVVGME